MFRSASFWTYIKTLIYSGFFSDSLVIFGQASVVYIRMQKRCKWQLVYCLCCNFEICLVRYVFDALAAFDVSPLTFLAIYGQFDEVFFIS